MIIQSRENREWIKDILKYQRQEQNIFGKKDLLLCVWFVYERRTVLQTALTLYNSYYKYYSRPKFVLSVACFWLAVYQHLWGI